MTIERRHEHCRIALAILTVAVLLTGVAASATAQTQQDTEAAWYVVGDVDTRFAAPSDRLDPYSDRLVTGQNEERVALGLTLTNRAADSLNLVAPTPAPSQASGDRFTFLVSGAYDWHTGTIVTPRLMAGVGLSYLGTDPMTFRPPASTSDRSDLAPAMQLGIGADVAVTGSLDLSAEYRAFYRGGAEVGGTERDPQIDQKFMLGAKIRF